MILAGLPVLIVISVPTTWYVMLFEIYWVGALMIMTGVTYLAMRNIHKNSQGLEKVGIKKDRNLMCYYIAFWVSCACISVLIMSVNGSMMIVTG